jgi:hypothetical protein
VPASAWSAWCGHSAPIGNRRRSPEAKTAGPNNAANQYEIGVRLLRDRSFADSSLEGTGFEPSVPRSRGDEKRREVRSARTSDRVSSNPADICIYGGAAGGGKTIGLILEPLRHVGRIANFTAVFFRRTTPGSPIPERYGMTA